MKIFLDTANVDYIREINDWGILDGVTTNPSLVAKEGRDYHEVIDEICSIVDGSVSAEVFAMEVEGMMEEAEKYAGIHKNVYVKLPMTAEGLKATKLCKEKGIKTNVTLVFSANQALLAAKAGATFVSPFIGRLDDQGQVGMDLIRDISIIFENYAFDTEILVASVRDPIHVLESALSGADIVTIPYPVAKKLVKHPLTDSGLAQFMKDWENRKK